MFSWCEYCNLSSPAPREVEPLEALARNTTQSESSDETDIEVVSQTSSDIQREINIMIQRVQNSINLDQPTFDGFTYRDLCNINIIHHYTYPHLYQMEPTEIGPSSSQHFPMDVSQGEEEEVEEWEEEEEIIILRTEYPLYRSRDHRGKPQRNPQPTQSKAKLHPHGSCQRTCKNWDWGR